MTKAIINLPSIDMTSEFTENASICDSLAVIEENLKTALSLNSNFAKKACANAIEAIKSIYDYVNEAKGNLWEGGNINELMYRVGVYNYLNQTFDKDKLDDELKDINDELVEFIINYRSSYIINEISETLRRYSLINVDDDDEYF